MLFESESISEIVKNIENANLSYEKYKIKFIKSDEKIEFDKKDGAQKDRFNDKDWSSGETIMPFFAFIDIKTKKTLEFKFKDTGLSSFELSL